MPVKARIIATATGKWVKLTIVPWFTVHRWTLEQAREIAKVLTEAIERHDRGAKDA